MYRVYILLFLAIGSSVFAVDSFQSILQAKKITDTSVTVSWEPIPDATKYKIFYDETALLEPANPRLMLDTDFITAQQGEITNISPTTEYTIMVHGYNDEGRDIGTTIPLHAETYSPVPQMNLTRDPLATNETTLELWFSRPIDVAKTQVTLGNILTKRLLPVHDIKNSPNDLRIIIVTLKDTMELNASYDLTLQKVTSLDGTELSAENRIPLKVIYGWAFPSLDTLTPESLPAPALIDEASPEPLSLTEPVPIDRLPQTGPTWFILFLLLSAIVFFAQKKLSKRA
jgi:Fibronectin type III domain